MNWNWIDTAVGVGVGMIVMAAVIIIGCAIGKDEGGTK